MTADPMITRLIEAARWECWRPMVERADQGLLDGAEWARDYAHPSELARVHERVELELLYYALRDARTDELNHHGDAADSAYLSSLAADLEAVTSQRKDFLHRTLDPISPTLLAFLRERRNRPVLTPDAVVISETDPYWVSSGYTGGFFEGAASVWRKVREEVEAALTPRPNPLATPDDPWGVPSS